MGLDTSHDCWHGPYSAFTRWRNALAVAADWQIENVDGYMLPKNIDWNQITEENIMGQWDHMPEDPLVIIQAHSDCDGEIPWQFCGPLADRLEQLLPKLPDGHGVRELSLQSATQRFIDGLREAAAAQEPVDFH